MAKPDADGVGEKEDSWAGDAKAIKHPRDRSLRKRSDDDKIGRREKIVESPRRCGCQDAVIEGLPKGKTEEKDDSDGDPSP